MVKIEIYRTQKAIVHDTLEYEFEELMQEFVADEEAQTGPKIRVLIWAQGIVMWITTFARPTGQIIDDEVNGILHYQNVTYAIKEKFEKRLVRGNVTINLLNQNEIPRYRDLAKELKSFSQWKKGMKHVPESYSGDAGDPANPAFIQNLETIKKEIGIKNDEEYEFIAAGHNLGLPIQLTADLLKQRRINGPAAEPKQRKYQKKDIKTKKSSIRNSGSGTDEKLGS